MATTVLKARQRVVSPEVVLKVAAIQQKIALFAKTETMEPDSLIGNIERYLRQEKVLGWTREEREDLWESSCGFLELPAVRVRLKEDEISDIRYAIVEWTM